MKHATMAATLLSTLVLFAGPATAQQWSGVAGIASGFGYSASPAMPITPQPAATVPADVSQETTPRAPVAERYVATALHRSGAPALRKVAASRPMHRAFASRMVAHRSVLARAKIIGVRRRARIA